MIEQYFTGFCSYAFFESDFNWRSHRKFIYVGRFVWKWLLVVWTGLWHSYISCLNILLLAQTVALLIFVVDLLRLGTSIFNDIMVFYIILVQLLGSRRIYLLSLSLGKFVFFLKFWHCLNTAYRRTLKFKLKLWFTKSLVLIVKSFF